MIPLAIRARALWGSVSILRRRHMEATIEDNARAIRALADLRRDPHPRIRAMAGGPAMIESTSRDGGAA